MIKYIFKKLYDENEEDIECFIGIALLILAIYINAHIICYLVNLYSEQPEDFIMVCYALGFLALPVEIKIFEFVKRILELKDEYSRNEEIKKIEQKKEEYMND
jgi:hypothetical protein